MNTFAKLLIILLFRSSNRVEPSAENETDSSTIVNPEYYEYIMPINYACISARACRPECCQLYHLYLLAKNDCTTDIDGRLAAARWYSPFSKDYHQFWKSVCSPTASSELRSNYLKSSQILAEESNISECDGFDEFCLTYVDQYLNFSACGETNAISQLTWLPTSTIIFSILAETFTLILILMVPPLHQRVQDKGLLFYLATRLIQHVFTLSPYFWLPATDYGCNLTAFFHQFIGLAVLFWHNVLCFHLWGSLKQVITARWFSSALLEIYSLYAFGSALLITVITHVAASWLSVESPFRPQFHTPLCAISIYNTNSVGSAWLQPNFLYFYSIMLVLTVINLCAFIDIARTISTREKYFKNRKKYIHTDDEKPRRHQKQQLGISTYLKLFVLMGTIDVLSWIILHIGKSSSTSKIILCVPYFLNGVGFLYIVLCNERVRLSVKMRFFQLKDKQKGTEISLPTLHTTK